MKKYILGIVLALLLGLGGIFNADTMALDGDYKNNLLKVDVNKIGDANYNIELYTQKPYSEPIKVIKKSDTSYYVLLPETYHSITSVQSSGDVSKVDVKLFPYAGQDLNNGYTKINISTSKPVTFTTNIKTATGQKPQMDAKKLAQLDRAFDSKGAEGKNIPVKIDTVKNIPVQTVKTEPVNPKTETKEQVKIAAANQPQQAAQNVAKKPAPAVKPAPSAGTEIEIVAKPKVQEPVKQQEITEPVDTAAASLEEVLETDEFNTEDELAMEQEAKEQGLTELADFDEEQIPVLTKKQRIKQALKGVLMQLSDNILLGICIILLLVIALLLVRDRKPAKEEDKETYTGLSALNMLNAAPQDASNDSADIIVDDDYNTYASVSEPAASEFEEYKPESAAVAVAEEDVDDEEADVLASESFGENRGLCLVNYDGSIALIGYIEDEIFVIQNFGKITLLNPSIQVRIAEQNDNDTIYIVKTANSKLMVRETKDLIGLEMVM